MPNTPEAMTSADALALFRSCEPVDIEDMQGEWKGGAIHTGHPLDKLLEASSWYGKRFTGQRADPLIHNGIFGRYRLNPGMLPMGLAMSTRPDRIPGLKLLFKVIGPLFFTTRTRARLAMTDFKGVTSAAMIYDQKPITDHFRRLDENTLIGMMIRQGDAQPCFFTLSK